MANLIDLEEIAKTWAWTAFMKTRSKDLSKLKYDDVRLEVNWSRVRFVSDGEEYSDKKMEDIPTAQIVFQSTFINNCAETEQEHSFQTERTTSCVSTTNITKGFTKGFNVELKLGLPEEVAGITAGFGRETNMETGFEDTQEKSLTWSVNSTIKVPAKTRTTAIMEVKEKEFCANYAMKVKVRGIVLVSITNIRDNNAFIQSVEGDFSELMKDEAKKGAKGFVVENRTVTWDIEGNCKFRFGIEQSIRLEEETIS